MTQLGNHYVSYVKKVEDGLPSVVMIGVRVGTNKEVDDVSFEVTIGYLEADLLGSQKAYQVIVYSFGTSFTRVIEQPYRPFAWLIRGELYVNCESSATVIAVNNPLPATTPDTRTRCYH